jgi:hypothetical protein
MLEWKSALRSLTAIALPIRSLVVVPDLMGDDAKEMLAASVARVNRKDLLVKALRRRQPAGAGARSRPDPEPVGC